MMKGEFELFLDKTLFINSQQSELQLVSTPHWDPKSQLVIASWIHRETGHLVSAEEIKQAQSIDHRTSF
jgi:hypothetical protein